MIVAWTQEALEDRSAIHLHIRRDNPRAAVTMDDRFKAAADRLAFTPNMGRPGKIGGTRELIPHPSYRLDYEVEGDRVLVLALIHTARRWPPENRGP